jgi:UDP-glucose 4-epimerase
MKWLITGGCGFIGSGLINHLKKDEGNQIRVVDNLSVGTKEDLAAVCSYCEKSSTLADFSSFSDNVELIVGDILDADLALRIAAGVDIVVHLAANAGVELSVNNPRGDCLTNVVGTLNYLEAAKYHKINRFIFASSGAPLGEVKPPIHEEIAPHPVSPYGASKLSGEGYCSAYFYTFGIPTVILRFGNVYGPGSKRKSSVVAKFIRQALSNEVLQIFGDGQQTRDFIFIDDLIRAIWNAVEIEGIGGNAFQIASNTETTVGELTENLIAILADAGIRDVMVQQSAARLGDVKRNFSDTSKAKKILRWEPRVDLVEGLRRTVAWFIQQQAHKQDNT